MASLRKTIIAAVVALAVGACAWADSLSCEQWAEKLKDYKTNTDPESKGYFGVPSEDVASLVKIKPNYDEAKALYEEFKKTGMDPDDCWQLRQAEYDIRVAIENYEGSLERILQGAEEKLGQAEEWLKYYPENAWKYSRDEMAGHHRRIENAAAISPPDSPRVKAMRERLAKFEKVISDAKTKALENVTMKPDAYKGKDADSLKALAKSIVTKAHPKAKLLRVTVYSRNWERDSVIEYTDTTKSALQHRITDGVYAQVAAKEGTDCSLYTLFLHKDTIGGKQGALQGHIMYTDKILEKNVQK